MARTDLGSSIILILFGLFVAYESWRMPRFASIGGTIHSAPGLVPGILGAVIALLGVIMLVRYLIHRDVIKAAASVPAAAATPGVADDQAAHIEAPMSGAAVEENVSAAEGGASAEVVTATGAASENAPSNARMLWTLLFSGVFALGLVGNVPFWLAVFLFVFVFIVWFERPAFKDARTTTVRLAIAAAIAGAAAFAVPFVFERIFLVNLP